MFCHDDAAGLMAMSSSTVGSASCSVARYGSMQTTAAAAFMLALLFLLMCCVLHCAGIIQWSCWNAIFALFLVYAHDATPWVRCTRASVTMEP
jgi:hypothetical protein